tara:strand:- start:5241 stop:8456 length:3216 start_codon:yes stop_codon:yes gene_type:complete
MRTFIFLLCTTVFGFTTNNGLAQEKVKIEQDKIFSVDEVFEMIINQTKYSFLYPADLFKDTPNVKLKKGVVSVGKLLKQALPKGQFNIVLGLQNRITIKKKNKLQQRQISGKVTDSSGEPLPNVTVRIKGTNKATASDFNGVYKITISDNANVLVFTSIGFETQEIGVDNQTTINITLKEAVGQLDEIVINAGYYNTTKKEATGSIVKVSAKDIENQPLVSPLQTLEGRMSGVTVTQATSMPGSYTNIEIRGKNSLRGDGNYPLYVVDGIPVDSKPISLSGLMAFGMDPLSSIGTNNIESIEVLKDADATSIYGSRGANGVVLITTKKGGAGKVTFNINTYSGAGQVSNFIDVLNTKQYLEMRNEAFTNDGASPGAYDYDLTVWNQNRNTDWQKVLYGGSALVNDVQASLSGGNANITFLAGGALHKEGTVFPGDFGYQKINGFVNINHTSQNKKFKVLLSANYGVEENKLFYGSSIITSGIYLAPNAPELYDKNGELNWENSTWTNPLGDLRMTQDISGNNLLANLTLDYTFLKGLHLKSNFGYTNLYNEEFRKTPKTAYDPAIQKYIQNSTAFRTTKRKSLIFEPQINYTKKIGKFNWVSLIGLSFQKSINTMLVTSGSGYSEQSLMDNLAAAKTVSVNQHEISDYAYNAIFGRLAVNYSNKYFLNLTGRRDGSSRFAPENRFANFGAIGAAWLFSEENFMKKNISFLDYGKIRGSYGITGSDQIGDYGYYNFYAPTGGGGLYPTQLANETYSWESNKKLELALELGFFNERAQVSFNWYKNRSSNQLIGYNLPAITGFSSVIANFPAVVENKGWEFEVSSKNIQSTNFEWISSFNLTIPKNELIAFPNIEGSTYANTYKVGESINTSFLYRSLGVNQSTGVFEVEDVDNNGAFNSDDRVVAKDLGRKFYGGLNNSLRFKNFELNFFFEFVKQLGRNELSIFELPPGFSASIGANQSTNVLDRWQQSGDISNTQKFSYNYDSNYINRMTRSDLSISDASYIRLKTLSLTYNIPKTVNNKIGIGDLKIFFHAQNLFTITNYVGFDPQSNQGGAGQLPPLRMLTAGIKLKF